MTCKICGTDHGPDEPHQFTDPELAAEVASGSKDLTKACPTCGGTGKVFTSRREYMRRYMRLYRQRKKQGEET